MSDAFSASVISAASVVIVAFVSLLLNKRMQLDAAWRTEKLEYYKELMDAIAMNVEGDDTADSHREFARASNNLLLVAPKSVLNAHHTYRGHLSLKNQPRDKNIDERLLADLIQAMRDDLRMPNDQVIDTGSVKLWSSGEGRIFSTKR